MAVRRLWPAACFEDGPGLPWGDGDPPEELFCYRDEEALRQWDEEGKAEGVDNNMIYLLCNEDGCSLVTDDWGLEPLKSWARQFEAWA